MKFVDHDHLRMGAVVTGNPTAGNEAMKALYQLLMLSYPVDWFARMGMRARAEQVRLLNIFGDEKVSDSTPR